MKLSKLCLLLLALPCYPQEASIGTVKKDGEVMLEPSLRFRAAHILGLNVDQGQDAFSTDYVVPLTTADDYPQHLPWRFRHRFTHRVGPGDTFTGLYTFDSIEHGGTNDDNQQMNFSDLSVNAIVNTDYQGGGIIGSIVHHYGRGDAVGFTQDVFCTGTSRGNDEGCEMDRRFIQFNTTLWGITVGMVQTDSMGRTIVRPSTMTATPGHALDSSTENALAIDTNPAKRYGVGNVAKIIPCPAPFAGSPYGCVVGDSASQWSSIYGASGVTALVSDLPSQTSTSKDIFLAGPVCSTIQVANASVIPQGGLFTIFGTENRFEELTALAVNTTANTVQACFARPHHPGEFVTAGGAVGHAFSFSADDKAPQSINGPDGGNNNAILRLAWPIVATLAGNIQVLWNTPSGNGAILQTRAFAANTLATPAGVSAQLSGGQLTGLQTTAQGFVQTAVQPLAGGAGILPPPQILFAGTCTTFPTAHFQVQNFALVPQVDTPGSGCTALTATAQVTYNNPYAIYPMGWIQSNQDPTFVASPNTDPTLLGVRQTINASTDGYAALGAALPGTSTDGISPGDTLETVYSGRQQMSSQRVFRRWVFDPPGGDIDVTGFVGVGYGAALEATVNYEPEATYYGTPQGNFAADAQGNGTIPPPIAHKTSGAHSTWQSLTSPPRAVAGLDVGVLIDIGCTDPGAPCQYGNDADYYIINEHSDTSVGAGTFIRYSPKTGRYGFNFYNAPTAGLYNFPFYNPIFPALKAQSGTRFLCIDTNGNLVSQTTACSGT